MMCILCFPGRSLERVFFVIEFNWKYFWTSKEKKEKSNNKQQNNMMKEVDSNNENHKWKL